MAELQKPVLPYQQCHQSAGSKAVLRLFCICTTIFIGSTTTVMVSGFALQMIGVLLVLACVELSELALS